MSDATPRILTREFTNPTGGTAQVNNQAVLRVEGEVNAEDIVRLCAYKEGDEPDLTENTPDENAVEAFRHGTTFRRGAVPIVQSVVDGDVVVLVGWASNNGGAEYVQFAQLTATVNLVTEVTVDAKNCLHFAWAPNPVADPNSGEFKLVGPDVSGRQWGNKREEGLEYHPVELVVPEGASQLQLSIVGETKWRNCAEEENDGSCTSDEMGRSRTVTTKGEYQHQDYRSEAIPRVDANLCMLVGLWGDVDPISGSPDANRIAKIADGTTWNVYPGATRLFLGFHDGYEWNNNSGQCRVSLTWS